MIIAAYSNSVNTTDAQLAARDSDLDIAIATTQQLIERNELLINADVATTRKRILEIGIHKEEGTAGYPWHWTKYMRNGDIRTSTEAFATAFDAALAAERIADCYDAPLSNMAEYMLSLQEDAGYLKRIAGKPLESCDNHHQHRGYQKRIAEELRAAIGSEAVQGDAHHWPPDDDEDEGYGWADYYADVVPAGIVTVW